jgi:segregation and condensation protein B
MNQNTQLIHALLFTSGETWRFSELAETLQLSKSDVVNAVSELADILKDQAVFPLIHEESVTLVTRPELKDELQKLEKEELAKEFSKGAIETLALIAYKGPIGKSDIDYIRGVNSQFMLRNLVMRGMIEKQTSGKGYVITTDALRFLGVTNRENLPQFNEFFTEIEKRLPLDESDISNSHEPVIQTELGN